MIFFDLFKNLGPSHPVVFRAQTCRAMALILGFQSSWAEWLLADARRHFSLTTGAGHPQLQQANILLALLCVRRECYADAISLLQEAYCVFEKTYGADSFYTANVAFRLGKAHLRQARNLQYDLSHSTAVQAMLQRSVHAFEREMGRDGTILQNV
jgi:hypothetical protein